MCERRSDGFLFGVLTGALIGAVAGVLFAPEEGSKTRGKLKKRLENDIERGKVFADNLNEKVAEVKVKAQPVIEELREKFEPVLEKLEDMSAPVKEEVASFVEDLKNEIEEAQTSKPEDTNEMKKRFFKGVRK
jgi:gas vesicle protein